MSVKQETVVEEVKKVTCSYCHKELDAPFKGEIYFRGRGFKVLDFCNIEHKANFQMSMEV